MAQFHSTVGDLSRLNIGPAAVLIDVKTLRVFLDAVSDIESKRRVQDSDNLNLSAAPSILEGSEWEVIGYLAERDAYSCRIRGVQWEANANIALAAAAETRAYLDLISNTSAQLVSC